MFSPRSNSHGAEERLAADAGKRNKELGAYSRQQNCCAAVPLPQPAPSSVPGAVNMSRGLEDMTA